MHNTLHNLDSSVCKTCEGKGCLIIKNAYDPSYEEIEQCPSCGGAINKVSDTEDFGPN